MAAAGEKGKIACISAPTLYQAIKQINPDYDVKVFEYDKRFAAYGEDFIFYDYKSPLSIPLPFYYYYSILIMTNYRLYPVLP